MKNAIYFILFSILLVSWSKESKWEYTVKQGFPPMVYPNNYAMSKEGIALGALLFNDKQLSLDHSISCANCHKKENAFADEVDFSVGINHQKQTFNTLALFNLAWNKAFFWDGRVQYIEEQISHPIKNKSEMASNWNIITERLNSSKKYKKMFYEVYGKTSIDSQLVVFSISQYLRSLVSDQSKFDSVVAGKAVFTVDEYEGYELVNNQSYSGACMNCHVTEGTTLGTNLGFANNGLEGLEQRMKIPSLRNLKFTAPYMHDGRFKKIEEVIDFYSNGVHASRTLDSRIKPSIGKEVFSKDEKKKIIAFLNTLNDYEFVYTKSSK